MQSSLCFPPSSPGHIQTPLHSALQSLKSRCWATGKATRLKAASSQNETMQARGGVGGGVKIAAVRLNPSFSTFRRNTNTPDEGFRKLGWSKLGLLWNLSSNTKGKQGVGFTL